VDQRPAHVPGRLPGLVARVRRPRDAARDLRGERGALGGGLVKLSAVIPAHNEVDCIGPTLAALAAALEREQIDYELIVVDDASTDGTSAVVERIGEENPRIRYVRSHYPRGFGLTVRAGLERFEGDAVALVMADGSDDPEDLVRYHRMLEEGWDCAFGSRFLPGSVVRDYPRFKLAINRLANFVVRVLFRHGYNDTTNAFKAYRREVIETVQPLLSNHFNITVELPLKAIVRGHSYGIVPISWRNRAAGTSKLSLQEMGSRYLFIVLYVFLEQHLSRGDYRRRGSREAERRTASANPTAAQANTAGAVSLQREARRRPSTRLGREAFLRVVASTPFLGLVVASLSWPVSGLDPSIGLDESWNAAVNLANQNDLDFGKDVIFTYGPLGFLAVPQLYYPSLAVLAAAYVAITHAAVCVLLVWAARRTFGVVLAVLIAYVAARTVTEPTSRFLVVAVFIVCVSLLRTGGRTALNRVIAAVGGALTGVELLIRLDIGLSMIVLFAATLVMIRPGRYLNLAVYGVGLLAAFVLGWVAAGQSFSAVGPFLDQSLQIASGYTDAMGIDDPNRAWEYPAALVVLAIAVAAAAIGTRAWPPSARVKAAVLSALFVFISFKHGFVRHDGLHSVGFFAAMFAGLLAFTWPVERRREALVALGTALVAFLAASGFGWQRFDPIDTTSLAVDDVGTLVGDRFGGVGRSRLWLQALYGVDPQTLDELRGRTVNIWPWEAGVAWAYPEFEWRPFPVIQSYSAYTRDLDELNREFLASDRAPDRILRHLTPTIDGRLLQFDSPAATVEMLCRYEEIRKTTALEVLARSPDRCGEPERLATVTARSGEAVAVPAAAPAGELVFARVHGAGPSAYERLRTLVYKLGERRIILNGLLNYRFVPGTAIGPLLMQVPQSADFTGPFRLSPDATSVAVDTRDDRRLTIEFFRLPIRGPGAPGS
jgi:dolichol-phosphate mannosyltransferase